MKLYVNTHGPGAAGTYLVYLPIAFLHCKKYKNGIAKTCRSTRTAVASELGAQGQLGAQVIYY